MISLATLSNAHLLSVLFFRVCASGQGLRHDKIVHRGVGSQNSPLARSPELFSSSLLYSVFGTTTL